jgi:hypothetical protein
MEKRRTVSWGAGLAIIASVLMFDFFSAPFANDERAPAAFRMHHPILCPPMFSPVSPNSDYCVHIENRPATASRRH